MHKVVVIALALVLGSIRAAVANPQSSGPGTGTEIGHPLPRFTAQILDVSGDKPQPGEIDSQRISRITAYVIVGTRCPATQAYAERLSQLGQTYARDGVEFVYIYPNREDTLEAKIAFHKEKKLSGRLIDDRGGKIARLLGAQRTSEVFLVDKKGVVVYHGAVDDARDAAAVSKRYMARALDETLAGKQVTVTRSQVFA